MKHMHDEISGGFKEMAQRITELGKIKTVGQGQKGYIPLKSMVPKEFKDHSDEWRAWQDDVLDYFDNINLGMREFLKEVEQETEALSEEWVQRREHKYGYKVVGGRVQIWRALKTLTAGEARKAILSMKTEDGFRAWQRLHMRFGPSLASRQGMVLAELSGMVAKPAKHLSETRTLVMELERRVEVAEDVTGEVISEAHVKSNLVGILDPTTRQHTAMHHGTKATYEQLKRVVLEFINNVARVDDAMQVGRVAHDENGEEDAQDDNGDSYFVNAFGKGQQCYNCRGYGRIARECPSKGKGKGQDKGGYDKGKGGKGMSSYGPVRADKGGKAKGKGPLYGGCWVCGGPHYQSE